MSRLAGEHRARPRRQWRAAGLVLLGTFLFSVGADALSGHATVDPRSDLGAVAAPVIQAIHAVAPAAAVALPVRLRIPRIGVDTSLQSLGLQPDGTLQSPSQWQVAGWFRGGVRPGSPGPAVIAGHIDSTAGPAVFYRLRELRGGDRVLITRADRSVVTFVVDDIAQYRKDDFPALTVYGPQPVPTLRLITCTGEFDWSTHNYLENLVVSAHLS